MKRTTYFVLRSLGDETVLVPCGKMAEEMSGVVTLSKTARFIYEKVETAASFEAMQKLISEEYQVEPERIRTDLQQTLEFMKQNQILEEEDKEKAW